MVVPLSLFHYHGVSAVATQLTASLSAPAGCLFHTQVRCAMVTGDHLRTAISVAHQCSMLPSGRPVLLLDGSSSSSSSNSDTAGCLHLSILHPDGRMEADVATAAALSKVISSVRG